MESGNDSAAKKRTRGRGTAGRVGLFAAHPIEDTVAGVLFGPHHGKAAGVVKKVILHVAITTVATAKVPAVFVFLRCAGSRTMGIGAANEPHFEWVYAPFFFPVQSHP